MIWPVIILVYVVSVAIIYSVFDLDARAFWLMIFFSPIGGLILALLLDIRDNSVAKATVKTENEPLVTKEPDQKAKHSETTEKIVAGIFLAIFVIIFAIPSIIANLT